jgi:hypothetical protein
MYGQRRGSLGHGRSELSAPGALLAIATVSASHTVVFGTYVIGESQFSPWSVELP